MQWLSADDDDMLESLNGVNSAFQIVSQEALQRPPLGSYQLLAHSLFEYAVAV